MNELKRGIKKLLTGYLHDDGSIIVPADKPWHITYHGTYTGALSARIFGVFSRSREYRLKMKTASVKEACADTLMKMGRRAYLEEDPEGMMVLCFPVLHNPCVLINRVNGNTVTVEFYAARTIRAFLNARRAFRQWEKIMPSGSTERIKQKSTNTTNKQNKQQKNQQNKGRRTS